MPVTALAAKELVAAEHEGLERKHAGLQPKEERMHQSQRIHRVEQHLLHCAGLFCFDHVVVAGIGVGDAAAARRHPLQPTFIKRLQALVLPLKTLVFSGH